MDNALSFHGRMSLPHIRQIRHPHDREHEHHQGGDKAICSVLFGSCMHACFSSLALSPCSQAQGQSLVVKVLGQWSGMRGQPCPLQRDDLNAFASERSPRPFVLFCAIRKMDAVSLSDLVGMQLFSAEIFGAFLLPPSRWDSAAFNACSLLSA